MPRRTKAESEATAAAVLDAAVALFGEHGYATVRLDDVAAEAGVTRGAVYHHFTDKPALFAAALARTQASVAEAVSQAADVVEAVAAAETGEPGAGDQSWEAFEAGCQAFLAAAARDGVRQIMLVDGPAVLGWQHWRELDAQHSGQLLGDAMRALAAAGAIRAPSLPALTAMLSGAMNEAALWVAEQPDVHTALADAQRSLVSLLRGAAAAPAAAPDEPQHA